ncbi:twin-arginine translocase subunit TatC [Thioflexithrix psekupsensis]|uniref:Sec-independent protein translocase protein TatC n=1 Tax=Thioflexithrix psekupsensis TaxID=1570016 RepID=A0A251XDH4_9GAMM|nr:twin-arginine translocase subunit TatC [Thioflexithrix psekupsensis]OUD16270.1 twin arginine-targeting protein translocase TatC [Thioflexithrix psekupsensis]
MTEHSSQDGSMSFVEHLVEIRNRLLQIVLVVLVILLALMPFANSLFSLLADPLLRFMPEGTQMIAIDVASPFFTPFKLTLVLAIFIAIPYIFYHVWGFVAPGLYDHEKQLMYPLLISSTLLFYLGMAFAYFVVFPLVFSFMISMTPDGVSMMTDISRYLDFVLKMFFAFGIAFEVPIATILLVRMGMVTPDELIEKRPYIIVAAFIIGMLMTPPDVISQTLLAVPIWILFEAGVFFSRRFVPKETNDNNDEYKPLTPEQMDAELARLEQDEKGK